jgi:hypothetical protein
MVLLASVMARGGGSHHSSTGPSHKRPSLGVPSRRQLDLCFIAFRQDGAMGLFLVLFWCSAVAGDTLRYNSRFGVFNSRLGPNKFPFSLLRELAGKGLIGLAVFAAKKALMWNNRKNSRFHGNNREFAAGETGGGTGCMVPICAARGGSTCPLPTAGTQPLASDGVPRTRPSQRRAAGHRLAATALGLPPTQNGAAAATTTGEGQKPFSPSCGWRC